VNIVLYKNDGIITVSYGEIKMNIYNSFQELVAGTRTTIGESISVSNTMSADEWLAQYPELTERDLISEEDFDPEHNEEFRRMWRGQPRPTGWKKTLADLADQATIDDTRRESREKAFRAAYGEPSYGRR
jgi:hypothetical protein